MMARSLSFSPGRSSHFFKILRKMVMVEHVMDDEPVAFMNSGQKLVIRSSKSDGAIVYSVEAGDTPFSIAQKFRM